MVAKYREEMETNGGVHGDAVRVADLAVRGHMGLRPLRRCQGLRRVIIRSLLG